MGSNVLGPHEKLCELRSDGQAPTNTRTDSASVAVMRRGPDREFVRPDEKPHPGIVQACLRGLVDAALKRTGSGINPFLNGAGRVMNLGIVYYEFSRSAAERKALSDRTHARSFLRALKHQLELSNRAVTK